MFFNAFLCNLIQQGEHILIFRIDIYVNAHRIYSPWCPEARLIPNVHIGRYWLIFAAYCLHFWGHVVLIAMIAIHGIARHEIVALLSRALIGRRAPYEQARLLSLTMRENKHRSAHRKYCFCLLIFTDMRSSLFTFINIC